MSWAESIYTCTDDTATDVSLFGISPAEGTNTLPITNTTSGTFPLAALVKRSAVGRISDGGKAVNAINARNAVPPAWPTVADNTRRRRRVKQAWTICPVGTGNRRHKSASTSLRRALQAANSPLIASLEAGSYGHTIGTGPAGRLGSACACGTRLGRSVLYEHTVAGAP
jgi:hypothetical protein